MHLKGRVVDAGRFKKWLDYWYCPTHGACNSELDESKSKESLAKPITTS
jgi:hypothetical protein